MNKERIIQIVSDHHGLFKFFSSVYNYIYPKNRLRARGVALSVGVTLLNGVKITCDGTDNYIQLGDYVRMKDCSVYIAGNHNRIVIGEYSYFDHTEFYIEDDNNTISIGEHTNLYGRTHLAAIEGTRIQIGSGCLFSSEIHFRTGDSHSMLDMKGNRINPSKDIIIDDRVWIGTKVTCLKGTHVAEGSIVAATTTLCNNYEQKNVAIAGVPGKIIKTGVTWCLERIPVKE